MMLSVGSLLKNGKYRIEDVLGYGGCGMTYLATHKRLHQDVVVKTLKSFQENGLPADALAEHFLAEAHRLAQLRHPNIVRVSDYFVEDQVPVMVMEFIAGQTLAQTITKGPVSESEAIRYIRDMGRALAFAHCEGMLHRNVKPSNAILPDDKTQGVTLIDFGLARTLSPDETQAHTKMLSAGFAPLEQYFPTHQWTPATDVYGLAATLYALTTGQTPTASVLRDHTPLANPRSLNPTLSPQTEHAILQGMALVAGDRPETVDSWLALLPKDNWLSPLGQTNPNRENSTALEPTLPVLEGQQAEPSTESFMPKAQPKKHRSQSVARRSYRVPSGKRSNQGQVSLWTPLPTRALIFSAIMAGLGGAGFGLYVKNQMLVPSLLTPAPSAPLPQNRIEESFPPKPNSVGLEPATTIPSNSPIEPDSLGTTNNRPSSLTSEPIGATSDDPLALPEEKSQSPVDTNVPETAIVTSDEFRTPNQNVPDHELRSPANSYPSTTEPRSETPISEDAEMQTDEMNSNTSIPVDIPSVPSSPTMP